jgi:hypothetical protein
MKKKLFNVISRVVTACLKIYSRDFGTSYEPQLLEKIDAFVNTEFRTSIVILALVVLVKCCMLYPLILCDHCDMR